MADFTTKLSNSVVAYSKSSVKGKNEIGTYINIPATDWLAKLKGAASGVKDGSHALRCALKSNEYGHCLPRKDENTDNIACVLILDCDSRITQDGEILDGCPDPHLASKALRDNDIGHILHGTWSHYANSIVRYRIIFIARTPYNKEQLAPTLESIVSIINASLDGDLLVLANENKTWAQAFYDPRKPEDSNTPDLWLEYQDGACIEVAESIILPPTNHMTSRPEPTLSGEQLSPINMFNEQMRITDLLIQYGYKKVYAGDGFEKWLSHNSTTRIAGVRLESNKIYSHHGTCPFNDGYWHDAFDIMRVSEKLSLNGAIIKAAMSTLAPDGRTVDVYNKSLFSQIGSDTVITPIPHAAILNNLIKNVIRVNFRDVAKITDEKERLKPFHFHVIVIETILTVAKKYNLGMCRSHDFIYLYNGAYWALIDADDLKSFIGNAAEKMGVAEHYARHFNFKDQLFKQFIASAHLPKPEQPKDVVYINLQNGTFEITPNGTQLKPFKSDDFITYQLPFDYDSNATAPLFIAYLNKVLPDMNLQSILAEYLGYVFIRSSTLKLEKTLILFGKGANGKSVFYEIVRNLFGVHNTSEYSLQTLTDDKGYQRAMIANKLVNYASEINGRLEAAIFKQLVSGEPVEARLPYGRPFIITDYAKLIFNCNELPKDVEQTEAYFRRFLIVPFDVRIPEHEQDKQLAMKIINAELSGIFNWVLEGLNRLLVNKQFTDSETVRNTRLQYEKESDSVKIFLDELGYQSSPVDWCTVKVLYLEYRSFCLDNGYKPVNNLNFKKRLGNSKIIIDRNNAGNIAYLTRAKVSVTS